ncbi:rhomboid family intramembrane serine protease [Ancylomarina sp. DW003]|nr:rhomboid family intramembrane serine protease [Ancylomarina sp. DW003]MDE5421534.1 rhomboid family intramembrane serine protease [Ancylomarina sp. DW003]
MENYFTKKMTVKSDSELQEIIDNKGKFQEDAYLAAIETLEKRKLGTKDLSQEKTEILDKRIQEQELTEEIEEEKRVERKRTLKESVELLIPSKTYFYTPIIIYLNILVFIVMTLSGVHPIEPSVEALIQWGGNLREITLGGQQWRLLTSVFLHSGLIHLLMNMYALIYIGRLLETKVGNNRYIIAYIATGLFASIASISFNDNIVSVGASGAIFGMYGLFLSLLALKGINLPKESRKDLISSILFFIGYNLFYGFVKEGIDNAAHIGGLLSGFIIGFAFYPSFKQPGYSKLISTGISVIVLMTILVMPKVFTSKLGEFQSIMKEFSVIEEKALWMYREDLSYIPPDKIQFYYDKIKNEGVDLWEENLELLNTLTDLPPYLQERVDLLTEYCDLRVKSCETMQYLLKYNRLSDQDKIEDINKKNEKLINELQALNG